MRLFYYFDAKIYLIFDTTKFLARKMQKNLILGSETIETKKQ